MHDQAAILSFKKLSGKNQSAQQAVDAQKRLPASLGFETGLFTFSYVFEKACCAPFSAFSASFFLLH